MKQIFKCFLALSFLLLTFSCRKNQPSHQTSWNSAGNNMVKVQSYDNNGNLIEYFIAYSLFNSLYNNGGYRSVNNYYYHNRPAFDRSYRTYKSQYSFSESPKRYKSTYRKAALRAVSKSPSQERTKSKSGFFSSFRKSSPSYKSSFRSSSTSRSSSSYRSSLSTRRR